MEKKAAGVERCRGWKWKLTWFGLWNHTLESLSFLRFKVELCNYNVISINFYLNKKNIDLDYYFLWRSKIHAANIIQFLFSDVPTKHTHTHTKRPDNCSVYLCCYRESTWNQHLNWDTAERKRKNATHQTGWAAHW